MVEVINYIEKFWNFFQQLRVWSSLSDRQSLQEMFGEQIGVTLYTSRSVHFPICASSLRRGHANLSFVITILLGSSEGRKWGVRSVVVEFGVFGAPWFSVQRSQNPLKIGIWGPLDGKSGRPKNAKLKFNHDGSDPPFAALWALVTFGARISDRRTGCEWLQCYASPGSFWVLLTQWQHTHHPRLTRRDHYCTIVDNKDTCMTDIFSL